jgi:hypothetical protein
LALETVTLFSSTAESARALADASTERREADAQAAFERLTKAAEAANALRKIGDRRCGVSRTTPVSGRLAPVRIQQVIRAQFGTMRLCYEDGLKRNPKLEGRVAAKFVIGRDGTVTDVADVDDVPPDPFDWGFPASGARMPDRVVAACVIAAFRKLVFPQPERGIVTVIYPIMFSPET